MVIEIKQESSKKMSENIQSRAAKYKMEQCVFRSASGGTLHYCRRLINPELPGEMPVLLFLHGAGERGCDNDKQLVHGCAEVTAWCEKNKQKALLLFPQFMSSVSAKFIPGHLSSNVWGVHEKGRAKIRACNCL